MTEPHRPPPIEPPGLFDNLRPGAILFGVVVDNAATLATSIVLLALFGAQEAGRRGGDLDEGTFGDVATSPEFMLASLAVGLLCTVFGAYVGAMRAGRAFVRHGGWIAVGSALVGALFYAGGSPEESRLPLWLDIAAFTLMLPAGALGGLLAHLRSPKGSS